ncbi:BTB/POZ domain-containing protein [Ananas comosus]|uniref:BTB/POZ domain-containing protein n=1 Tax=Ananas comosus TaxID=4615 RepID=A0A199VQ97_ANACO|nr:BTB/POZ domain-containing protein [Ananas comosus]
MARSRDRVRFNVGGVIFETTSTTLANAGRDSMLGALLDDSWNLSAAEGPIPEYFIDRNPACFGVLLDLLRTGELHVPAHVPERLLLREALFYGLLGHVRAARWGRPLDGSRLQLARSVPGRAPGDGTAVRASPDGGCCVAHGVLAHVYDWALHPHPPLSLDHQPLNDAAFLSPRLLLLSARERAAPASALPCSGLALFDAHSSALLHRFPVSHRGQPKSFTAGALALDDAADAVFASCKGRFNEYGVGVWDAASGRQSDFFYQPPGCPLGDADKLQWLPSLRCLMVASLFPRTDDCFIGLLDFRSRDLVWSWSDAANPNPNPNPLDDKRVLHAIATDDNRSVCVVNQYDDLGFIDLRTSAAPAAAAVRWSSRSKLTNRKVAASSAAAAAAAVESCYPKLAMHNGQLFSSMNDSISVFCGPEFVLTSTLRRSYGGPICDFSIGGDRLFALHNEENVFDVWETPPAPIII